MHLGPLEAGQSRKLSLVPGGAVKFVKRESPVAIHVSRGGRTVTSHQDALVRKKDDAQTFNPNQSMGAGQLPSI